MSPSQQPSWPVQTRKLCEPMRKRVLFVSLVARGANSYPGDLSRHAFFGFYAMCMRLSQKERSFQGKLFIVNISCIDLTVQPWNALL